MADGPRNDFTMSCPLPAEGGDRILLAHGGGGRLSQQLIESVFLPAFLGPHGFHLVASLEKGKGMKASSRQDDQHRQPTKGTGRPSAAIGSGSEIDSLLHPCQNSPAIVIRVGYIRRIKISTRPLK